MRVRTNIELREGVKVAVLVTPALYRVAKQRGVDLSEDGEGGTEDVFTAYTKMLYCAAINAWEVDSVDSEGMGPFPYKYADFVEYMASKPGRLNEAVNFIYEALTGKTLKEGVAEELKKKTSRQ